MAPRLDVASYGLCLGAGRGSRYNDLEGRDGWDAERKPDVGERDRPGRRAHALNQDDVVYEDQAAVVLDPIPLEEDVGSTRRGDLLICQPAVVGRLEYFVSSGRT